MKTKKRTSSEKSLSWLPIDSRIIPPIFSFNRVRGISRFFLGIEMLLASLIVLGTLSLVILWAIQHGL